MDEQDIEFLICDISVLWRRAFSLHTKEMGISTIERRIILNVERRPGATQVEIANLIDIEPQNLTKPLDRLIAHQLLEKRLDDNDRRVKRLYITKNCIPIIKKICNIAEDLRPMVMAGINEKDRKALLKNISAMKHSLEALCLKK
jgi:MarR family transcriptional regulator for hemolysin